MNQDAHVLYMHNAVHIRTICNKLLRQLKWFISIHSFVVGHHDKTHFNLTTRYNKSKKQQFCLENGPCNAFETS